MTVAGRESARVLDEVAPLLLRVRNRVSREALRLLVRPHPRTDLVRLGTAYGGWWVPRSLAGPGSVCYCAGVGEDASFDLELVSRGCLVLAMDPTPRAIAYVAALSPAPGFRFVAVGLAGSDRTERFYAPRDPEHVSHSMTNLQRTSSYFEAPVKSLVTLMREHGHDRVDLLKMDIEGGQHEVLAAMHRDGVYPTVLCIEFDQPEPLTRTVRALSTLRRAGYVVVKVERTNVTLVRTRTATPRR